ncbi:hypothetical protein B5P43_15625 [Bacillus sp. SRB_336]|nr:hypothetical protein B5P43_15625 [Bacillus sp. SRB_336]
MCRSKASGGRRCNGSHGKTGRRTRKFFGRQHGAATKYNSLPTAFRESKIAARAAVALTATEPVVVEAALHDSPTVREALAANVEADAVTVSTLAKDPSLAVLRAVAKNPATDPAILDALAENASPSVRKAVQEAKEVRPAKGEKPEVEDAEWAVHDLAARALAKELREEHPGDRERGHLAAFTDDPAVRAALLRDGKGYVRQIALLKNRHLPPVTGADLDMLAGDAESVIRAEVAKGSTSPAALAALLADPEDRVRIAAQGNTDTPLEALIARVPYEESLAHPIAERLGVSLDELPPQYRSAWERGKMAAEGTLPEEHMRAAFFGPQFEVAAAVLHSQYAPADLIGGIAQHPDAALREHALYRADLPDAVVTALGSDQHAGVRAAAVKHFAFPADRLYAVAATDSDRGVRAAAMERGGQPVRDRLLSAGTAKAHEVLAEAGGHSLAEARVMLASPSAKARRVALAVRGLKRDEVSRALEADTSPETARAAVQHAPHAAPADALAAHWDLVHPDQVSTLAHLHKDHAGVMGWPPRAATASFSGTWPLRRPPRLPICSAWPSTRTPRSAQWPPAP